MFGWPKELNNRRKNIDSQVESIDGMVHQLAYHLITQIGKNKNSPQLREKKKQIQHLLQLMRERCNQLIIESKRFTAPLYYDLFSFTAEQLRLLKAVAQNQLGKPSLPHSKTKIILKKERGSYRSYSRQEKNKVVMYHLFGMSFASISKSLNIPQKNVVRWCREGLNPDESNKRSADHEMERKLWAWKQSHPKKDSLYYTQIQEKALELSSNSQFKASRGWVKNFLKRYESKSETSSVAESLPFKYQHKK